METYKDKEGYQGMYQVSNLGNVKSLSRVVFCKKHPMVLKEKILKAGKIKGGYLNVVLSNQGIKKNFAIHRLVAIAFIPNPNNLPDVNHIDGNKLNNNYLNLEWITHIENHVHRFIGKNKSSKYCGVHWNKNKNKWQVAIRFNGKTKYLGIFINEKDAYQARINFENNNNIVNKYL